MENKIYIRKFSKPLSLIFGVLMVLIPVATAGFWIFYNALPMSGALILKAENAVELDAMTRSFLFMVSLIPVFVITFGLYKLMQIFQLYSKGIVFSQENVTHIRHLGKIILAWVIVHFLFTSLSSLVIALNGTSGESTMHISLHPMDIMVLVIGIMVILISKVMDEARIINESQNSVEV